jgi:hypothetical protein
MTLKYSGKSFRKVVWKITRSWARLHEEAFRTFGGSVAYVVLDNLKAGVIRPDLYEPELNAVYAALLAHYGVVADPCRVGDPNRKGTVENAIQHTQSTALKGRKFESIEEQNAWLAHWEERWAAPRIHGRKKRQVLAMFAEESPLSSPCRPSASGYFKQQTRTVDDAGPGSGQRRLLRGAAGSAPHARSRCASTSARSRSSTIGQVLRRHQSVGKGQFVMADEDRLFNPSRETARLLTKVHKIGPHSAALAREIFARRGRPGQRAIYGLANLARRYACADIEAACQKVLTLSTPSYQAVKRLLEQRAAATTDSASSTRALSQAGAGIRPIDDYQAFFEQHAESAASTSPKTQRNPQ